MGRFPNSLVIALWIVGVCWAMAVIGYLFGFSTEWVFPLVVFGIITGIAEWVLRRGAK